MLDRAGQAGKDLSWWILLWPWPPNAALCPTASIIRAVIDRVRTHTSFGADVLACSVISDFIRRVTGLHKTTGATVQMNEECCVNR